MHSFQNLAHGSLCSICFAVLLLVYHVVEEVVCDVQVLCCWRLVIGEVVICIDLYSISMTFACTYIGPSASLARVIIHSLCGGQGSSIIVHCSSSWTVSGFESECKVCRYAHDDGVSYEERCIYTNRQFDAKIVQNFVGRGVPISRVVTRIQCT